MKPTGVIAQYESVDGGGAEIWMRVMLGGQRAEWGQDTEFPAYVHACTHSDDQLVVSEDDIDDIVDNTPSPEADRWNENHAREWAEENVGDLVDVDSIPTGSIEVED